MNGHHGWNGIDGARTRPDGDDDATAWGNQVPPSVVSDSVRFMANRPDHQVEHAYVTWGRLIAVLITVCAVLGCWIAWVQHDAAEIHKEIASIHREVADLRVANERLISETKRLADLIATREQVWSLRFDALQNKLDQALTGTPTSSATP